IFSASFFLLPLLLPLSILFPYTTLFKSLPSAFLIASDITDGLVDSIPNMSYIGLSSLEQITPFTSIFILLSPFNDIKKITFFYAFISVLYFFLFFFFFYHISLY